MSAALYRGENKEVKVLNYSITYVYNHSSKNSSTTKTES